jgi:hypothetical protein
MTTVKNDAISFCPRCGIPIGVITHDGWEGCAQALILGNKRQTQAAENLAFEVSTRLFGILEGLAHDPDVAGVRFHSHNHDTGEKLELPGQIVIGVMTAIFREYQKMGDWTPLADSKKETRDMGSHAYDLMMVLKNIVEDNETLVLSRPLRDRADAAIEEAMQHGVHLHGHGRS